MLEIAKDQETTNKLVQVPLIEVKDLPSRFKCYPEGTEISYEPITLGELDALNSGSINIQRGMDFLINAIHCNTLDPKDLAYFDVIYIGVLRKLHAFGNVKGTIAKRCPSCGNIVKHEFDYTEIEFIEIADDIEFPVTATINGVDLEFGLITYSEFLQIDPKDGIPGVYARMVKNKSYEEALEVIKSAYGEDIQVVKAIEHFLTYGIKPFIETCQHEVPKKEKDKKGNEKEVLRECGTQVAMEVQTPFEVVFPDNRSFDTYKAKIHFGRS